MKYTKEIEDLKVLVLSRSQGVKRKAATQLGSFVKEITPALSKRGVDIFVVVSAVIQILELLQLKGKWRRFFKIGKIVFATVRKMRTRAFENYGVNMYFIIPEFVDRRWYKKYGAKSIQPEYAKMIALVTYVREQTGKPVRVNDWFFGGRLSQRGFRAWWSRTGSRSSQHRKWNAIDFDVIGQTTAETMEFVRTHEKELYKLGLRRVELTTNGWVHFDGKETNKGKIYYFKP